VTRALVWKELREQWVVWLALAVAAVGGVAALRPILPGSRFSGEMLVCILWLGAWGYGLVSGSLLLAGETEEQTQAFLDLLPGTRRRLWWTKAGVGLVLLAAQAAFLGAAGYLFSRGRPLFPRAGTEQLGVLFFGISGYAFGLHSGSRSDTVLGAIGRGALGQVVIALLLFPVLELALPDLDAGTATVPQVLAAALVPGLIAAGLAVRSRQIYCRLDRLRDSARQGQAARPSQSAWDESFRLAWWEARWFTLGMAAISVAAIAAVATFGVIAWPFTTSLIGLVCGLSASVPDGPGGQCSPAGRRLFARAGVRLVVAAGASSLTVLVPLVLVGVTTGGSGRDLLHSLARPFRDALALLPQMRSLGFFPTWLLNGFAVGLLCGFLARGSLSAGLLAVPGGCFLGGLLLGTGFLSRHIDAWQVWAVPPVLFAAAWMSARIRGGGKYPGQTVRPVWDEPFWLAWWEARWFAAIVPAVSVLAVAAEADRGGIAWPLTTAVIGIVCGLSASAAGPAKAQRPLVGLHLLARGAVRLTVSVGSSLLTVLVTLVLVEFLAGDVRAVGGRAVDLWLREAAALLPPGHTFALLPGWLLNGFAVGLLCGLFARGSLAAGLLAVPGGFCLGALLLNAKIFGEPVNACQASGVPVLLLAALAASAWWDRKGGTASALRSAAAATVATLATALWWAAVS
jgi:hypothetical protein